MTNELKKMLELAYEPDNQRRREIVASLPREMSFNQDGEVKTIQRELLLTESIESGLIQTEVHNTISAGADLAKCWFNVLPTFKIKGNAYNYPVGEDGLYAAVVAEGAEFPNRTQNYSSVAFATKKYGVSPKITNEMIEDGMIDVIANELRFAGIALQNAVEVVCLNELLLYSGAAHDTGGTNQGLKAIISAKALLRGYGFNPTDVVMCPEAEAVMMWDMAPQSGQAGILGSSGTVPDGTLAMNWHVSAVAYGGGTYTWSYDTGDDEGILVLDAARAGAIGISRPLTIENYDDPIHDLKGMACSMRMDCQTLTTTAAIRVQY